MDHNLKMHRTTNNAQQAETGLYVFAGGGTGGHLFPGIATATELQAMDPGARIVFAGSDRPLENEIVVRHRYEHWPLGAQSLAGLRSDPVGFAIGNWQAFRAAASTLRRERASAVIGLGGFASAPWVLAARRLRIPTVLLEQNVIPGRATSWLARRASLACVSFDATRTMIAGCRRVVVTGNPVRLEIAALCRAASDTRIARRPPELLVLGGSQGARGVNAAAIAAVEQLRTQLAGWSIVHQAGRDADSVESEYRALGVSAVVAPFFSDMTARYAAATLVISRAGATTLAELACAGRPAILIPYPNSARDHQVQNARAYEAAGAAVVIEQRPSAQDTGAILGARLAPLLVDTLAQTVMGSAMRSLAKPRAAEMVARHVLDIAGCSRPLRDELPARSAG